jgi:hypothetical protein
VYYHDEATDNIYFIGDDNQRVLIGQGKGEEPNANAHMIVTALNEMLCNAEED